MFQKGGNVGEVIECNRMYIGAQLIIYKHLDRNHSLISFDRNHSLISFAYIRYVDSFW